MTNADLPTPPNADSRRVICDCADEDRTWLPGTIHRPPDGIRPPCPKWRPLPKTERKSAGQTSTGTVSYYDENDPPELRRRRAELRALDVRCLSLTDDPTTPSGMTQCADDAGHDGPHWHVNAERSMAWESDWSP